MKLAKKISIKNLISSPKQEEKRKHKELSMEFAKSILCINQSAKKLHQQVFYIKGLINTPKEFKASYLIFSFNLYDALI